MNKINQMLLNGFLNELSKCSLEELNLSSKEMNQIMSIVNSQTESQKMKIAENYPILIEMITLSQKQEFQLVKSNPYLIKYIKKQNSALALVAFSQKSVYISHMLNCLPVDMKNDCLTHEKCEKILVDLFNQEPEHVQLLGIYYSPHLIQYIKKPSEFFLNKVRSINKFALDYLDKDYVSYNGIKVYQHSL